MKKVSEKIVFNGNWLSIIETEHINKQGQRVIWETVQRKNIRNIVVVLAQLIPSNRYVLIKQFRPAINKTVLGFPAGLNPDNDIESQALKELHEETGYYGKITEVSPELALSPAMTNETVIVCHATIDETDPRNLDPQQDLEPEEQIEVVLVNSNNVREFLIDQQALGIEIGVGLWYLFAINTIV
ncbi:MAG: NUDIX hydrolase [Candidatus Omnitrophica bacterium]|nr:NUDIX hydrolase [Candidatus Omnitrophota bacterium]